MERVQMRNGLLSVVAAAALLTSIGAAYAKGPVTLTDDQLDKITAGTATGVLNPLTYWIEVSQVELALYLGTVFHIPPYNPAL
jgi:predicted small lipoprotein YifL